MSKKIIVDLKHISNCHYLTSSAPDWTKAMTKMWNKLTNKSDRPVKRNMGNQLQMCQIFSDNISRSDYLGLEDFLGEEPLGHMIFGDMEEITESLIWGPSELGVDTILPLLNKELLSVDYVLELKS